MPSHAAMNDKFLTASPGDNVEDTLKAMKKAKADIVPVVDEKGAVMGVFTVGIVLENLLPVSVAMSDGIQLDIQIGAAPGIAKRLKKVLPLSVGDLMNRKFDAVYPETPLWETVNQIVMSNRPVIVVEPKSGKALGIIDSVSALEELNKLKD
jgi:predicted transcriptional regulator